MYQQSIVSRRLKLGLVKMMYPPENGHYTRKLVSQPSVFRGYGTFLEGISWLVNPPNVPSSGIRVQEGLTKGNQMVNKRVIRPYLWGGVTLEGGWLTSHKSIFQMFFYSQQTYFWGAQKKNHLSSVALQLGTLLDHWDAAVGCKKNTSSVGYFDADALPLGIFFGGPIWWL